MRGTVAKRIRKQTPSFPNDRPAETRVVHPTVNMEPIDFYLHHASDFRRRYRQLKRLHYVMKLPK